MAEKKNGDYEKPESHDVKGDELEDVSGGSGQETLCQQGATAYSCVTGPDANMKSHDCLSGGDAEWLRNV